MDEKAYAVFIVKPATFEIVDWGDGFPDELAEKLWGSRPYRYGDTTLARFYASGLQEGPVELTPMAGSTFTKAYFWRDDSGGITVIKGRYW